MDIGAAMTFLRAGRKAHRRIWIEYGKHFPGEYCYITLDPPNEHYDEIITAVLWDGRRTAFNPSHSQLLAQDWEEYSDNGNLGQ